MEPQDPYAVLEVTAQASDSEVATAYRRLARKYHPDHNQGFQQAADAKFKQLCAAYEVLRDPQRRQRWDVEAEVRRRAEEARARQPPPNPAGPPPRTHSDAPGTSHSAPRTAAAARTWLASCRSVLQDVTHWLQVEAQHWREGRCQARGRAQLTAAFHDCGAFAVDTRAEQLPAELRLLHASAQHYAARVSEAEAEVRRTQALLKGFDRQPQCEQARALRDHIAAVNEVIRPDKQLLADCCRELGGRILTICADERFEAFASKAKVASETIEQATSRRTRHGQRRDELLARLPLKRGPLATVVLVAALFSVSVFAFGVRALVHTIKPGTSAANHALAGDEPLTQSNLASASPTLEVAWETWRPGSYQGFSWVPAPNVASTYTGSACVLKVDGNKVYMLTNRHMLSLDDIAATKTTDLALLKYKMEATFPSGETRAVLQFACPDVDIDLAMLLVDGSGLQAGKDYVVLADGGGEDLSTGDELVAVGAPQGLMGTQTFGRVSAIRQSFTKSGLPYWQIQTDTAINHGNSGGPLFLKRGDRYFWVGVNTWGVHEGGGSEGLNFAIHTTARKVCHFTWFGVDKAGASAALAAGAP